MKRSERVKPRVSWIEGPKLCQVKLFRKEERPSKVGPQPQPQNFSKHSSEEPDLPPGFENYCVVKPNVSNIPQIKWKRPRLKFSFNHAWRVADGSESTEREIEHLRISKVLEAFYPHPSAIPSGPAVSRAVEAEHFDDSKTPGIPLTPIEDKLESKEESSHSPVESGFSALQELVSRLVPVLSSLVKEHGSMIDADLLVKFLSDPEMVKILLTGTTCGNQPFTNLEQSIVASHQPFTNPEQRRVSPPLPAWLPSSSCVGIAKEQPLSAWLPSSSLSSNLNLQRPQSADVTGGPKPVVQPMTTKDHVKNLIREHGKDNHHNKVRKQCIYFGTARGCRNGDGCLFAHDRFRPNTEAPRTKRYKFGRYAKN